MSDSLEDLQYGEHWGEKCWSMGPESDWCGEHESPLNVPDPNDPELLICQFVASGFGHHEDLAKLERKQTANYLRGMACAPGQEWTGSGYGLAKDHGHTTCWHLHRAADWLDPPTPGVLDFGGVAPDMAKALKERWNDGGVRPTEASDW